MKIIFVIPVKSITARDVMPLYKHAQFVPVHLFLIVMDQNVFALVDNLVMALEDVVIVK